MNNPILTDDPTKTEVPRDVNSAFWTIIGFLRGGYIARDPNSKSAQ